MVGDLLPCPFCGGEAERRDIPSVDGDPNAGGSFIDCRRCGASSALHFEFKENLVSVWNERAGIHPAPLADDIEAGLIFAFAYPFVRETFDHWEGDGDGVGGGAMVETPTWKPGVRFEMIGGYGEYEGEHVAFADGVGQQICTVIDVHKPGRFPTRVFYTRQWLSPDGATFGKGKLRITTLHAFRGLIRGYRHAYTVTTPPTEGGE